MALSRKSKMVPKMGKGKQSGKLTRKMPSMSKQKASIANPMISGGNGPGMMPGFG